MGALNNLYESRAAETDWDKYLRGYMHALADLENIVDNSEHLDDSCLLEALYEALVNREVLR